MLQIEGSPKGVPQLVKYSHINRSKKGNALDLKTIKQVVELMNRADLSEFELEEEGLKLRLCRKATATVVEYAHTPQYPATMPVSSGAPASTPKAAEPAAEDKSISVIKSPMVGTFYRAASPDSQPFVDIGSKVSGDSTVCIIEAMKVMNEIASEIKGVITEILVENGEPVEYGQPLFKIKTA
jgi:acetyl-CoA carboxylase biotin carboxyl carrier protein